MQINHKRINKFVTTFKTVKFSKIKLLEKLKNLEFLKKKLKLVRGGSITYKNWPKNIIIQLTLIKIFALSF